MRTTIMAAGIALCATGCASIDVMKEQLASTKPCCRSPAEFNYKDVPASGELDVNFGEGSPVFDFSSGRSYFAALKLNPEAASNKLRLKMSAVGSPNTVLCPSITFLKTNYEPIEVQYREPRYVAPGMFTNGFFFSVFQPPKDAAYAVIHSETERVDQRVAYQSRTYNPAFGAVQLLFPGGPTQTATRACAPAGSITLDYVQ